MQPTDAAPTRKEFLLALAGAPALPLALDAAADGRKALIVVAHPDDEYALAATTYRLSRELGWTVDQVVVTNGEGGYRYAALAEQVYGVALTRESDGRRRLPAIRRQETLNAGKVLGVREHHFLDQHDSGFDTDATLADTGAWDQARILDYLLELLRREDYSAVFTLLPTAGTHAHHRAAALLLLEAVEQLDRDRRPAVFGAEPGNRADAGETYSGLPAHPLTRTANPRPLVSFDRTAAFGYHDALNYQIVVNWVIAEHKSQGLFQSDSGRHQLERFWLFAVSGASGAARAGALAGQLSPSHYAHSR